MDTEDLILELKEFASPTFFPENVTLVERWFADAAGMIQKRRRVTTVKEQTITTVDGTYEYALAADAVSVEQIVGPTGPDTGLTSGVDLSNTSDAAWNAAQRSAAMLPNGQLATPSIDLMRRQTAKVHARETVYRVQGGKIIFDFEAQDGTEILVRYRAEDREPANVPDRHVEAMLLYARSKLVSWTIQRHFNQAYTDSERWLQNNLGNYRRQQRQLDEEWITALNSVCPEVAA